MNRELRVGATQYTPHTSRAKSTQEHGATSAHGATVTGNNEFRIRAYWRHMYLFRKPTPLPWLALRTQVFG
ncbi:MAG TPA: hypothetical protein VHZ51_00015 [Ktedonobacteraceae bacterium]|nr:hypothetical protein [Ktedonobacteraceae bacterium]